jgi:hypothetical protein
LQDGNAIYQLMLKRFSDLDHDGVGKLPLPVLRGAMETLSRDTFGLSNMQQLMLMAEVQPDKHNRCDYRRFIQAVTPVIQGLLDIAMAPEREKAIAAVGVFHPPSSTADKKASWTIVWHWGDAAEFSSFLSGAFCVLCGVVFVQPRRRVRRTRRTCGG